MQVSSTGHELAIRFRTDNSVNGRGFSASWQAVPGGCGGIFQAPSGEIHSPNYPSHYRSNTECSWVIQVENHHRVLLNFTDFDLQTTDSCIMTYDGSNSATTRLASVCGRRQPENPITSSGNSLFVRFQSGSSRQSRGFRAQFKQVNHITLSFIHFGLEGSEGCTHDFVEVLDGLYSDAPLQGRYCGTTIPHPITSFSNGLMLRFVSDSGMNSDGFQAVYAASTSACGGNFHMGEGIFNSPGYPEIYPPNVECVWNIVSSPGNQLQLSF
uniref:Cubilin-like n=1 Tax=Castor canadensis TaxID=51338 RepID=A0A8B7TMF3_CASCN